METEGDTAGTSVLWKICQHGEAAGGCGSSIWEEVEGRGEGGRGCREEGTAPRFVTLGRGTVEMTALMGD